jgi:lipopolysaccharide export system protein LptC
MAASPQTLGPAAPPSAERKAPGWLCGIQELLSAYLPMLLMALLAAGTWWLVKNTPLPLGPTEAVPKRHEPDYVMQGFDVQRFDAKGELRVRVAGREARHYPDSDTLEIDDVLVHSIDLNGNIMIAKALRGLSNADGSEVQLLGEVRVQRFLRDKDGLLGAAPQVEIQGEFVHAFVTLEKLRSNKPVRVSYPGGELRAQSLDYDNLKGLVELGGRSRMQMSSRPSNQRPGT